MATIFEGDEVLENLCQHCGGEGWLLAEDGDGSDWQEDTYAGLAGAEIKCRYCKGKGTP